MVNGSCLCGSVRFALDGPLSSIQFDHERGVIVPVGVLDADPTSRPARHLFVALKAPWFTISDDLPQFERDVPESERW
jgi:hypothetical protein